MMLGVKKTIHNFHSRYLRCSVLGNTFTTGTANEAGMKEKAMITTIAAENASRSYKVKMKIHESSCINQI
jgi:hypothetical protein